MLKLDFINKLEQINNNPNIDVLLDNLSVEHINYSRRLELIEQIRKAIKNNENRNKT